MRVLKKFLKAVREELFPENFTCDICGAETFGTNLCADCLKCVPFNDKDTCPICGRKTFRPEICMECKNKPPLYKKAVSPLVYSDGGTVLVSKFKKGRAHLKEFFADKITADLVGFPKIDCIVYVPLSKISLIKRGYNQSFLLAEGISERTSTPVIKRAVVRVKKTKMQKDLSRKEREENVRGAFKVDKRGEIKDKSVLLVDDVMTTGATVGEISKILIAAGAKAVYVATAASVEYRAPTRKDEK